MRPKEVMLIAGEASGDMLAAELVTALRKELTAAEVDYTPDSQPLRTGLEPRFFGAGGPRMKAAGVELVSDFTEHSIIGIPSPRTYIQSRNRFHELLRAAIQRQPDVIIGVDFNYFNLKFAAAIREYASQRAGWFQDWRPKLVKYISPQVWASRGSRAYEIAEHFDLLLSIFPFEKDWYAQRVPKLRVEFVGHPMVDRFLNFTVRSTRFNDDASSPRILLLPGSRKNELKRHLPVLLEAFRLIRKDIPQARGKMVLPSKLLADRARAECSSEEVEIQVGGLAQVLPETSVAISKTGTITMECAFAGVPTITMYKVSWAFYEVAKRLVKLNSITMPNLLAGEAVFPEFIQNGATPESLSTAALELLRNESRRKEIKAKLGGIVASLGGPGASRRAAQAIVRLLEPGSRASRREYDKMLVAPAH